MASSIMSFENRGPWGDSRWRGNCSGHVVRELLTMLKPNLFVDAMVGSGTSVDVAREMGVEVVGLDLHSGFDALTMSILERVGRPAGLVFSHPPYGGMIRYSGEQWGDAPHPNDLSRCKDDEDFHQKLQRVLLNQREATAGGGVYGALIGDWRTQGRYVSFMSEMIARMPKSELASVIIKAQHNTMSGSKTYGRMRYPFVVHEYLVLWEKPRSLVSALDTLAVLAREQHERLKGTWKSLVQHVLVGLGGEGTLKDIYDRMAACASERIAKAQHWQAKVRQTLQLCGEFRQLERGTWALAS